MFGKAIKINLFSWKLTTFSDFRHFFCLSIRWFVNQQKSRRDKSDNPLLPQGVRTHSVWILFSTDEKLIKCNPTSLLIIVWNHNGIWTFTELLFASAAYALNVKAGVEHDHLSYRGRSIYGAISSSEHWKLKTRSKHEQFVHSQPFTAHSASWIDL